MTIPDDTARASAALIAALHEAQGLAARGRFDSDFRDLIRHARDLHDIIMEALAVEPQAMDLRSFATMMGERLVALETLVQDRERQLH